jgi:undecaprenyl-diphosphatase
MRWTVVSASVLVAVLIFGLVAAHTDFIDHLELPVVQWFSHHHSDAATSAANLAVLVFEPFTGAVILLAVALVILAVTRRMWPTVMFLVMTFGTLAGAQVLKWLVQRDRPPLSALADPPPADPTFSFPSGHTTVATVLVVALVMVVPGAWKWLVGVAGGMIVLMVAVSRFYLGSHYPSDVVAAILVGTAGVVLLRIMCAHLIVQPILRKRSSAELDRPAVSQESR